MPGHPEDIGRANPGQVADVLIEHGAEQPGDQHRGHRHQEEAEEDAPPLAQGWLPAVAQGGGQGGEIGGTRGDGPDVAIEQKRGKHGSGHKIAVLFSGCF